MIITAWCSCMAGASRCCNHVIAVLYKVEYANANNFCSSACTSIPCDWNKSTKKIIEPKRISEIAVRKKMRSSMGDKPKDTIPRVEKRMQELNLFDLRTNIDRNVTGERLSEFFYSPSLSNPSTVLLKSTEGILIATSMNLSLTNITNEVVVNHKNSSSDEKITLLLRKSCFTEKEIQNIEKSTRGQSDSNAWKKHRIGRLTASKHHELYINWSSI